MTITSWLCLIIILLLGVLTLAVIYDIQTARLFFRATNKNIKDSVRSQFLKLSPEINDIIELAVEIWRLEKRLQKTESGFTEDQQKAFENSVSKLQRYLDKNDISFTDYTGHKYNEGLNLDVLSMEKDPNITESIIKETHEPAVLHRGQLIKKAKVIVLEK